MDAILLIIGIAYGVCRIVIKSVQQCTYFLFSVNLLLVGGNYEQRTMPYMDNDSLYQIHAQFVINNKINKTNARKCISLDIF
jgi:hypothetical protein